MHHASVWGAHIRVAGLVHRPVASLYVRVLVLCICLAGWCLPACAEGQNDLAPASQTDRLGAAPSVHLATPHHVRVRRLSSDIIMQPRAVNNVKVVLNLTSEKISSRNPLDPPSQNIATLRIKWHIGP